METMKDYACMEQKELIRIGLSHLKQLAAILECLGNACNPLIPYDYLMTRKEAAHFLGRTVQSIDRLVREGKLHKEYVNGESRLRKSELLRHIGYDFSPEDQKPRSELERILLAHGLSLRKK